MLIETVETVVKARIATCPRPACGYKWQVRKATPKCCPKCKRYIPADAY